jgi:hypothetical protein
MNGSNHQMPLILTQISTVLGGKGAGRLRANDPSDQIHLILTLTSKLHRRQGVLGVALSRFRQTLMMIQTKNGPVVLVMNMSMNMSRNSFHPRQLIPPQLIPSLDKAARQ